MIGVGSVAQHDTEQQTGNPTPEKTSNVNGDHYSVGDKFQLGDYKYAVQNVSRRSEIGSYVLNEFMGARASPGATFVVVRYVIENCTKKSQTVLSDDFKLIDSQGRQFEPSSDAGTALLHESNKDFLFSELQPGVPRNMTQAFEVPIESLKSDLTIVVPEKGFLSHGEAKIRVRVY